MCFASVGIDVSKTHLDVAIRWQDRRWMHQQFAYTTLGQQQILDWLEAQAVMGSWVCLEATGRYSLPIATLLHRAGYRICLEAPYRTKHFAKSLMTRQKTDKVDAQLLAQYVAVMTPREWSPPTLSFQNVQDLKRLLDGLNEDRTRVINRLEGLRLASPARQHLEQQLGQLEQRIQQVKQELAEAMDDDDHFRQSLSLLTSIKGIGKTSAQQLLAEIADWSAFGSADDLVSFAGLSPQHFQSGQNKGYSRLSKRGNANIRKTLYFPALSAMQHNPHLKVFAQRLKTYGKAKMQVVVAVMRKLLVLAYAIIKSGKPYDPHYQPDA